MFPVKEYGRKESIELYEDWIRKAVKVRYPRVLNELNRLEEIYKDKDKGGINVNMLV